MRIVRALMHSTPFPDQHERAHDTPMPYPAQVGVFLCIEHLCGAAAVTDILA
jgi:hypothetical protein